MSSAEAFCLLFDQLVNDQREIVCLIIQFGGSRCDITHFASSGEYEGRIDGGKRIGVAARQESVAKRGANVCCNLQRSNPFDQICRGYKAARGQWKSRDTRLNCSSQRVEVVRRKSGEVSCSGLKVHVGQLKTGYSGSKFGDIRELLLTLLSLSLFCLSVESCRACPLLQKQAFVLQLVCLLLCIVLLNRKGGRCYAYHPGPKAREPIGRIVGVNEREHKSHVSRSDNRSAQNPHHSGYQGVSMMRFHCSLFGMLLGRFYLSGGLSDAR